MTEQKRTTVLRRMTRGGRPPPEFGEVSPAKALRLALAKAGQDVLAQVVNGSGVEESRVGLGGMPEELPEGGLTILTHGPGDTRGLISLDRSIVAAITESLTTGRVSTGAPPDRKPSKTDALLCQRFLVMVMTIFAARLVGHPAASWATGFVPEEAIEDLRRLPVLMEDVPYRVVRIETDFAGGAKTGQLVLVVPWEGQKTISATAQVDDKAVEEEWNKALERVVLPTETVLEAVLYRLKLPLSKVTDLKPGTLIPIPRRAIAELSLESRSGEIVSKVRLGQSQGHRAVRLEQAPLSSDLSPRTELESGHSPAAPALGLADAMASAPTFGDTGEVEQEYEMPDMPALDLDTDEAEPMAMMSDLPEIGGEEGAEEEYPPLDLDNLPMADLDDLPMTID